MLVVNVASAHTKDGEYFIPKGCMFTIDETAMDSRECLAQGLLKELAGGGFVSRDEHIERVPFELPESANVYYVATKRAFIQRMGRPAVTKAQVEALTIESPAEEIFVEAVVETVVAEEPVVETVVAEEPVVETVVAEEPVVEVAPVTTRKKRTATVVTEEQQ
jgi:hypothetical protein